jgi:hypothetical protein
MAPPAAALAAAALFALGLFHGCSSSSRVTSCIEARVGGKLVCLRPGERCNPRYEQTYRSFGLTCPTGILREHNYIGPANP